MAPKLGAVSRRLRRSTVARQVRTSRLIQVNLILFCLAGCLVLLGAYVGRRCAVSPYHYAIISDCGSTHSMMVLFRWSKSGLKEAGEPIELASCEVDKGIAKDYGGNHEAAAADLIQCTQTKLFPKLDCATSPESVPVTIAATAGMRVLNLSHPTETTKLFDVIKESFKAAKINIKSATIINGTEEGAYAWVGMNYVAKKLTGRQGDSVGVMDLGGASMQISQEVQTSDGPDHGKSQDVLVMELLGARYDVFAISNLCFGNHQAFRRYFMTLLLDAPDGERQLEAACLPKDYRLNFSEEFQLLFGPCNRLEDGQLPSQREMVDFVGTGEAEKCKAQLTERVLNREYCQEHFQYCAVEVSGPKSATFYMMGDYSKVSKGLELGDETGMVNRGKFLQLAESICTWSLPWVEGTFSKFPAKLHLRSCFLLNYIDTILTSLFHFSEEDWAKKLHFDSRSFGTALDWELGAGVMMAARTPTEAVAHSDRQLFSKVLYVAPGAILLFVMAATVMILLRTGGCGRRRSKKSGPAKRKVDKSKTTGCKHHHHHHHCCKRKSTSDTSTGTSM